MRISTGVAWMTLVAATVLVANPVRAERVDSVSWAQYQQRVDELESELKALKSRLNDGRGPAPTMQNASYAHGTTSTEVAGTAHGFHGESTSSVYSHDSGSCGSCCDDVCCRPHGLYAGGAVVWVKPHFQQNVGLGETLLPVANVAIATQVPFDYDYDPSSRVWLGYVNEEGLGVRGSWWQYDHAAPQVSAIDSGPLSGLGAFTADVFGATGLTTLTQGDAVLANHSLQLDVYDLEATKRIFAGKTALTFSGGARYVSLRQRYTASFLALNQALIGLVENDLAFDGIGPTVGLELVRPLGFSGFALYGATRGSILFGSYTQEFGTATAATFESLRRREEQAMGIFEAQIGAEYAYIMGNGARLFARGVVEAQYWTATGSASSNYTDMGLIGFGGYFGIAR